MQLPGRQAYLTNNMPSQVMTLDPRSQGILGYNYDQVYLIYSGSARHANRYFADSALLEKLPENIREW